ncbi:MAG TPA: hypothetical protein VLE43_14005 [Candidatus Saccharimonadia bacterium]|nr:hypothetical protein [Candidatus Saccharimonadia bacterium]
MRLTRCLALPIVLTLLLLLPACERKPDLARANVYRNSGLELEYPGNWTMESALVSPDLTYIMIQSPGESFVMIRTSLPGENDDLRMFALSFPVMVDETASITVLNAIKASDGEPAFESHHVLHTMGTTVECTRVFRKKTVGGKTFFFLNQATDHAFPKVSPGFDLIVKSLSYKKP